MGWSWQRVMDIDRRRQTIWLSRGINVNPFQADERQWYILGDLPPNYPVPAIPLNFVLAGPYLGIVYIDDMRNLNGPIMVYCHDTWWQHRP